MIVTIVIAAGQVLLQHLLVHPPMRRPHYSSFIDLNAKVGTADSWDEGLLGSKPGPGPEEGDLPLDSESFQPLV